MRSEMPSWRAMARPVSPLAVALKHWRWRRERGVSWGEGEGFFILVRTCRLARVSLLLFACPEIETMFYYSGIWKSATCQFMQVGSVIAFLPIEEI